MRASVSGAIRLLTVLTFLALIGALVGVAVARLSIRFWIALGLLALLLVLWQRYRSVILVRAFRRTFGAEKDFLLVYTESPHWQPYIEQHWVPKWGARMVLFNRSRPWSKDQVEARLWQSVRWHREHTPLAIIVPRRGLPQTVELYSAFRDFKHGKPQRLETAEARIQQALEKSR
jgi:hypothetical protein